jgi:PAS domain S-box-containing protein
MNKSEPLEADIQANKVCFRTIFDQTSQFIGLIKPDGTVVEVNQTVLKFAGLTSAKVIGRFFWEVRWWTISPQTQAQLQEAIALAATGEFVRYEVDILGAGNNIITIDFSIKPIKNESGQVILLISEGRDISEANAELKQRVAKKNEALLKSERRWETFAKISPVGIFRTDVSGNYLYVNERWCEISGITSENALGKGWRCTIPPEDLERIDSELQHIIQDALPFKCEFRFIHADGKVSWVLSQAVAETKDDGKIVGYFGTVTDISERKQSELALKQRASELTSLTTILAQTTALLQKQNQELDQFAYVASHDLKAPLRAIASLSEWISEDLADQLREENRHQMHLLRGRVQRMEGLINGLLEYSRIGRVQTESYEVNVGELIKEVIDLLAPPLTFSIEVAEGMPTFRTKRLPLQQVFSNLISNAIKHHPRIDGHVKISVEERVSYYEFAVADDGAGIAPEYHEKIFAIFQTLQSRDQKESTGIGLAIVKKIVEAQGGTITLKSQINAGSTFCFTWQK